jgi:hypothetical protein
VIDFSRAFDLAWERMMVILFRPFDIGKWLVIGFSAFLAGLLQGGNGFNFSSRFPTSTHDLTPTTSFQYHSNLPALSTNVAHAWAALFTGAGIFIAAIASFFVMAIVLLFYWLGARGQFLFLDNIVRNRGEITWPWRTYARQGNNLFVFMLIWLLIMLAIFIPIIVGGVFVGLPFMRESRWPEGGEWALPVFIVLVYLIITIPMSILFFLFRELGVPLMFRNGITARAALGETWQLFQRHPGSLLLLVLLRLVLLLGLLVVSVLTCCLSCCVGLLPYIGTVLLLPALIYIKCFTLDCLAQLGPEYDVWTVDLPPGGATVVGDPGFILPPPL